MGRPPLEIPEQLNNLLAQEVLGVATGCHGCFPPVMLQRYKMSKAELSTVNETGLQKRVRGQADVQAFFFKLMKKEATGCRTKTWRYRVG